MRKKNSSPPNHFPLKLYELLDDAEENGHSHVICWCPDGKSFRINNPNALVPVLNKYFRQTKYKSLLRQLQGYNFKRVTSGVNKGNVSHPLFMRGMRSQCTQIKRKQNKPPADPLPESSSSNSTSNKKDSKNKKISSTKKSPQASLQSTKVSSSSAIPIVSKSSHRQPLNLQFVSSGCTVPQPSISKSNCNIDIGKVKSNFRNTMKNALLRAPNQLPVNTLLKVPSLVGDNAAGHYQRRQPQQTPGMDALRVEIGCTFSSSKKVNHNVKSASSLSSFKRKAPEQRHHNVVQSSKSEPNILERERLSKRKRFNEGVNSFNSSDFSPSSKNASFSFPRRGSEELQDDAILADEKMQFEKIQREKQKQKEFERLEKLCFSNFSQVPGTQQFQHSHNSTSAFGTLDLDISLTTTTTTTTHCNGGDSQVSSSTISKNFVFPAELEPTPIRSPRREAKASSGITLSCNIDFPSQPTNNQKIYQDIVMKLPSAPTAQDIPSADCNSIVGDSLFNLPSEPSDEIDEDIAETFGETVNADECPPAVDVENQNEEDEQDDWTKGVVYEGKADCVLEPDKFQIEVQHLLSGKRQQQVPQPKQNGLQQSLQLEHNILQQQLQQQRTMMQLQGSHDLPPRPFQVPQRRYGPINPPYALLSRPMPFGHHNLHRPIQQIKR